jgi:hypothetical protein
VIPTGMLSSHTFSLYPYKTLEGFIFNLLMRTPDIFSQEINKFTQCDMSFTNMLARLQSWVIQINLSVGVSHSS